MACAALRNVDEGVVSRSVAQHSVVIDEGSDLRTLMGNLGPSAGVGGKGGGGGGGRGEKGKR